jgi:hypothetical protein
MLSDEERKNLAERLFGRAMRDAQPLRYTKSTERVAVPQDLREFLVDVHRRIADGDEAATIPSDDLLQSERAYGGLVGGAGRYSFVYFPGRGTSVRWEFTLLASEIEEIGAGGSDEMVVQRFEKQ